MRRIFALSGFATLALSFWGCGSGGEGASKNADAERYAENVATFERAIGNPSGTTDAQKNTVIEQMRSAPVFQNRFLGISTLQKPSDAWIIMELMQELEPDLIVEAGTYHGGSAVLWAIVLEHINPEGRVVTIDIEDKREPRAIELPIAKRRVAFLLGSSTDPDIVAEVHRRAQGKKTMVLLDSLHSKEHVANELEAYAPLIPVGGYLIVQDTKLGARQAIDEFLAANDSFVADRKRERYPDTNTVGGYLRRVAP